MKPLDDKAFTASEATLVKQTATGLGHNSTASIAPQSSSTSSSPAVKKAVITISAYDAREAAKGASQGLPSPQRISSSSFSRVDSPGIPVTLNAASKGQRTSVVQIGCFSADTVTPKKLSADQLKSFQGRRPQVTTSNHHPQNNNNNRSVTFICGPGQLSVNDSHNNNMMTMMSAASSPTASSKNSSASEMDNFALDSGTCSDLEINSSSSSLNNSITPPPPPLPKKMNKTKEKLKSENEKFFQLKNYPAASLPMGSPQQHQQHQPQALHLNDQDDNVSVLSSGSHCSSFSLLSCDSLNGGNRQLQHHHRSLLMPHSPITTTTSYSSGSDSPTPSSVGDPPVIVSDPDNQNAIVLSVKPAAAMVASNGGGVDDASEELHSHRYMNKKNLLPTSLLADIRSTKRSAGGTNGVPSQKNVNVISIRSNGDAPDTTAQEGDNDSHEAPLEFHHKSNGGGAPEDQQHHQEKYLTKKFINFSIHSMMDNNNKNEADEEDNDEDKGYFEGGGNVGSDRRKSAFASIDSRKSVQFENDSFYNFHINENNLSYLLNKSEKSICDTNEDSFAGYRDLTTAYSPMSGSSTIRSNKGTIRGVKNRVRNGIATFLQMQHANIKVSG